MITDRLLGAAQQWPDRIACRVGEQTITYKKLWEDATKLADLLEREGDSPVILWGGHSIAMMTALAACLLARRAYVPVGNGVPEKRCEEIVRLTGASLVLRPDEGDFSCLEAFQNSSRKESNNTTAYIIFTSGSTGTPKGVPVSYENLDNFAAWIGAMEPLRDYDGVAVMNQAPLGFDLSVCDVYYALCGGHTWTAVPNGLSGLQGGIAERFVRDCIGVAVLTPSALKMCLLEETFREDCLPELKAVFCCGERLEKKPVRKLFARFPNIRLINAYGPTEATCAVCAVTVTPEMLEADEELPVGRIDTAATEIVAEDGEIVLLGPSVFQGYVGGLPGGHFTRDGRNGYRTGDLGYIKDGLLYCKGRKDSQIKYKGYRIEPEEIECAIRRIDGVSECAVVAKRKESGAVKTIQAYVVAEKPDGIAAETAAGTSAGTSYAISAESVKKALAEVLPSYMIPKTVVITESLPHNTNGKIDRKALERL